jgi:hypothetical protein
MFIIISSPNTLWQLQLESRSNRRTSSSWLYGYARDPAVQRPFPGVILRRSQASLAAAGKKSLKILRVDSLAVGKIASAQKPGTPSTASEKAPLLKVGAVKSHLRKC